MIHSEPTLTSAQRTPLEEKGASASSSNYKKRIYSLLFAPLRFLVRDQRGLSSVEYVILLVMIVVGAVATWKNIGTNIKEGLGKAESDSQIIVEGTGH